jgi:hypothetical protein
VRVVWGARLAGVPPPRPRRADVVGERLTRPFALQTGALRNSRDASVAMARVVLRRRPRGGPAT